jgi:transcriptional regulator with XRE-family HTH domain
MITKEQCRAARSFLGLKQVELANDCGLSKTAITHFESGLFRPRSENMTAIKTALESRGIEFLGQAGVQKRETAYRLLEGENMYVEVWDDIFETLRHDGGEVCIGYCTEREPAQKNLKELEDHLSRLKEHNITERIISCEGDDYFIQDPECYRWLPYSIYKSGNLFFVYGNKVVTQYANGAVSMIINNKKIAEHERKRFEYLWGISRLPDCLFKR